MEQSVWNMTSHERKDIGKVRKFEHPGRGRNRARSVPKGRQVDPHALTAVKALLGDEPRDRHLLIEYLHRIQDAHGQISADHLGALAAEMRLAFAEVFETATFYAHFDVVKEDTDDVPRLDGSGVRQPDLRDVRRGATSEYSQG